LKAWQEEGLWGLLHVEAAKERELMEMNKDSLSLSASYYVQCQAGEGTNLCHFFFLLLALEMDLVEAFLDTA
jgi:hypothetical protein